MKKKQKIKPVKAWGLLSGAILIDGTYHTKQRAIYANVGLNYEIVRVEIRVVK